MELFVNYFLYLVACVCVLVPVFGLGLAPGIIINLEVVAILSNTYSQIAEKGLLKTLMSEKKESGLFKPLLPALANVQKTIDSIENGSIGKKKVKTDSHDAHHIIPISVYAGVLGILLVGTVITVAAAQFDFGSMNTVIAMAIATIKAGFVMLYFMHLRYDDNMNRAIFGSGFFFLILLFAFSVVDIYTRIKPLTSFPNF